MSTPFLVIIITLILVLAVTCSEAKDKGSLSISILAIDGWDDNDLLSMRYRSGQSILEIEASQEDEESSPWRIAPYAVAATALLYPRDEKIQHWIQDNRSPATDRAAEFAKQFGEPETYKVPLAVLYLYGQLSDDERARRTVRYSINSLVIGAIVTQTIKAVVNRQRPNRALGDDPFDEGGSLMSFPSGHTMVAFLMATVLSSEYGQYAGVRPVSYTIAGMTGWSRMNDNSHWASDVVFGAFIGYTAAKLVMQSSDDGDIVNPGIDFEVYPVQMRFRF